MQVITTEFKQAVLMQLNNLQDGFYLTRDQLCAGAGVETKYALIVSLLLEEEDFKGFEAVKSRGIRRLKNK